MFSRGILLLVWPGLIQCFLLTWVLFYLWISPITLPKTSLQNQKKISLDIIGFHNSLQGIFSIKTGWMLEGISEVISEKILEETPA